MSLGGVLALAVVVPLLPLLMPELWRAAAGAAAGGARQAARSGPGSRHWRSRSSALMVVLFLFGEDLPIRIVPPAVAIIAASLALLVIYGAKVEPVDNVFHDIDWKTLLFLGCIFCLVQAVTKTGLLQRLSRPAVRLVRHRAHAGGAGADRGDRPALEPARQYSRGRGVDHDGQGLPGGGRRGARAGLAAHFTDWPDATIPVFVAMMFGATLGGNATLIGAVRQRGDGGHLRAPRQTAHLRGMAALRPALHGLPARRLHALRAGPLPFHALTMLETGRLRVRRLRPSDEPALVALDSDEEVMRYIGSRGGTPEQILARARERIGADGGAMGWWLVEDKADGVFRGIAGLLPMPEGPDVELAYRFTRATWGRGIATEAALALTAYAFAGAGLSQLVAVTFPENSASRRVLEKVGFTYDGMTDYKEFRVAHFTVTAAMWRARG